MKLENRVAIVTGGAHGIGLAVAKRYVAEGARVTIADVDSAAGEAAAKALGNNARFVATDVGDARAAEHVVAETCRAFGDLDILVNNAGIIHGADFLGLAEADFDRVLRVNLKGAFLVGQAAARRMVAQVAAGGPPGGVGYVVQVAGRVRVVEVDRRRDDAMLQRQRRRHRLHGAARTQQVPDHALHGAHSHLFGAAAEDRVKPEAKKGGDQGQDDDFDDHLRWFPVISATAGPRLTRVRQQLNCNRAPNRCRLQMNNAFRTAPLLRIDAFWRTRCDSAMAVLARGPRLKPLPTRKK